MTGFEKIIKAIEGEAKLKADQIISEAKEEAEKIIASAKEEAEKKCSEIAEKPAYEVKAILDRANSGAALIKRQTILNAKQQAINDVIEKAKLKLTGLPDKDYFDIIIKLVKKHAHNQAGTIKFSGKDLKRLPENFDKILNEAVKEIENASLSISKESAPIDSGFILVYGDIEQNCSFEALFGYAKEELQDKVNTFLFG